MMQKLLAACLTAVLITAAIPATSQTVPDAETIAKLATPDTKDAIVKIYTYHDVPDYQNPWSRRGTFASTGSGCIIKGKKILSNAHVVSDQTFIQIRRYGEAKRYQARVLSVSHAVDLAILTVDDPKFFEGATELGIGDLPKPQQEVLVYGFPLGGDTLSITKGVISRIEHQVYSHSSSRFLAVQIDAAINPGNSGGPAIVSNKVVGVAMQGISQADNIGYIVPAPIIHHFLTDLEDGTYDGFPSLGMVMQNVENPDLKRKFKMGEDQTGVLVVRTIRNSPARGTLEEGDIILSVEGHPVADDGTVEFREKERTSMSYYIQEKQVGDKLNLQVLRDGEVKDLTMTLDQPLQADQLVAMETYDVRPRYYIYGGLVFCPVTVNLLHSWGKEWYSSAPVELVSLLGHNYLYDEEDEVVILLKVLAADVNQGYQDISSWAVNTVDGEEVISLSQMVDLIERDSDSPFITFGNEFGQEITLDREKVSDAHEDILRTYRVPEDRYLEAWWPWGEKR